MALTPKFSDDRALPAPIPRWRQKHRTLLRAVALTDRGTVRFVMPGWRGEEEFELPVTIFPEAMVPDPQKLPQRYFLKVVLSAQKPEDLQCSDFEFAPDPDPDDGLS